MYITALNSTFHPIRTLPYLNLQWRRRYYEPGTFSIRILADDYDSSIRYLLAENRPEVAMVQQTRYSHEVSGDFVQLSGCFLEAALNRVYAYPHITGKFTLMALGKRFIEHPWYAIDLLHLAVNDTVPSDISIHVDWQDEPLGDCAYQTLKTLGMSQRIRRAPSGALLWETWQGLDRSSAQSERPPIQFRDDSPHVTNFTFTEDESGYRNHAVVFYGSDSAGDPYRHDVYTPGWQQAGRRWILMRVNDTLNEAGRTQKAHAELTKYPIIRCAELNALPDGSRYLQDYDLGDLCDVACTRLNRAFSARVTGIDEVFKENRHQIHLILGESPITETRRVWRQARSDTRAISR